MRNLVFALIGLVAAVVGRTLLPELDFSESVGLGLYALGLMFLIDGAVDYLKGRSR